VRLLAGSRRGYGYGPATSHPYRPAGQGRELSYRRRQWLRQLQAPPQRPQPLGAVELTRRRAVARVSEAAQVGDSADRGYPLAEVGHEAGAASGRDRDDGGRTSRSGAGPGGHSAAWGSVTWGSVTWGHPGPRWPRPRWPRPRWPGTLRPAPSGKDGHDGSHEIVGDRPIDGTGLRVDGQQGAQPGSPAQIGQPSDDAARLGQQVRADLPGGGDSQV
jgi:hypothetical protein